MVLCHSFVFLVNVFRNLDAEEGYCFVEGSLEIPTTLRRIPSTLAKPPPFDQGTLLSCYILAKDTLGSRTNFPWEKLALKLVLPPPSSPPPPKLFFWTGIFFWDKKNQVLYQLLSVKGTSHERGDSVLASSSPCHLPGHQQWVLDLPSSYQSRHLMHSKPRKLAKTPC